MTTQDPQNSRVARRKQSQEDKRKHSNPNKKKHGWLFKVFVTLLSLFVLGIIFGAGLFVFYAKDAPKLDEDKLTSAEALTIYDSKGKKITSLGTENVVHVDEKDIPQTLKDAITSIEDRRFYKHKGIDPTRIVGAVLANITGSSGGLQGGSTLDQQLIKLSFFSTKRSDQTLKRKAQEAWLALQLDRKYTKDQILTFYVNKAFMGNGCIGMQTAAKYYYGKDLSKLDLAQTALIAGIPNAPSSYNPYSNQEYATARRNAVLNAMVENKKITQAQANQAKQESITEGLLPQHEQTQNNQKAKVADSYIKQVIAEIKKKGYDPYKDSLKVYTNLDMGVQQHLYDIVNTDKYIYFPDDDFQIATTIIDPNNGNVVAMIGGRKTGDVTYGLNRAVQTNRTNGSTAKPLMDYGPAIEYLSWATYHALDDSKYIYPGTNIELNDFDNQHKGEMTMREALVESRNIPAVRALQAVGITRATNFISKLGFNYKKPLEFQNGIGLPSSTLQNAAAYAAFANGGTYYKPNYINKIETPDGSVKEYSSTGKQVMQSSTAYMITDMLKGVFTSPLATGYRANIPGLYQAGKTGTNAYPDNVTKFPANAIMDSWFNGYTKHYSVSVWTGYDKAFEDGHYISSASSGIAALIYKYIMLSMSEGKSNTDWTKPSNVYTKEVNGVRELYLAGAEDPDIIKRIFSETSILSSAESSSSEASETTSSSSAQISATSSSSISSESSMSSESSSSSISSTQTQSVE